MTAKSAPQLLHAVFRRPDAHSRRVLLLLLTFVVAAMAWLLDQQHRAFASQAPAAPSVVAEAGGPESAATQAETTAVPRENSRLRALSEFLARRYKVSQAITLDLVTIAHTAGHQIGLDPLLIIAVMAVESRFNPIAESGQGAKGLMQIIPKYHLEKFRVYGGEKYAVFDPETNILVGTQILKDYIAQAGSLNGALQLYVGASSEEDDPYIGKVMTEKQRLQQVIQKSRGRPEIEAAMVGQQLASLSLAMREPASR
jgi:soluble lytic murein transglycosylase-like protein